MGFSCFIKLLIGAALLSLLGFYAEPYLGLGSAPVASVFATGLLLGAVIGGVATALYPTTTTERRSVSKSGTVYVGNLPFSARKEEVEDLFRPYGTVINVRLVTGANRRPKGYGFVEMDPEGAKEALKLNGVDMGGRKLRISEAKEKGE